MVGTVPSSDGSPCHEVRPIEPAKSVSPGQQSFAPSNTYDVLPGVWPGQCRQRMDWPAIVRTSPSEQKASGRGSGASGRSTPKSSHWAQTFSYRERSSACMMMFFQSMICS